MGNQPQQAARAQTKPPSKRHEFTDLSLNDNIIGEESVPEHQKLSGLGLQMEFDFDRVQLNDEGHIPLAQFLQIHSVFLKQTVPAQLEDGYRDRRRECHLN